MARRFRRVIGLGILGAWASAGLAGGGNPATEWGPHAVGWRDVSVPRPESAPFVATVVYPATATGHATPLARESAPYPAVTFGHGFMSPPLLYFLTIGHLTSHGYIVVAPQSGLSLLPDWHAFADDFRYCLDDLERRNDDPNSFLYRSVDTNAFGMTGHSMGGGSSILAAAIDPRVRAVVPLTPARFGPPSDDAIASIQAPICLVAAGDDAITPMSTHTWPLFLHAGPPSLMVQIHGGSHCQVADLPIPDPFCDPAQIDPIRQREIVRSYLVGFLDLNLKGRPGAWGRVWGPDSLTDPDVWVWARPGVILRPRAQFGVAAPGRPVTFEVIVRHQGVVPDRFRLSCWGTAAIRDLEPTRTPMLEPGQECRVRITLTDLPEMGSPGIAVLNARSERDGATGTYALLLLVLLGG